MKFRFVFSYEKAEERNYIFSLSLEIIKVGAYVVLPAHQTEQSLF
jgi:hypothetical protein